MRAVGERAGYPLSVHDRRCACGGAHGKVRVEIVLRTFLSRECEELSACGAVCTVVRCRVVSELCVLCAVSHGLLMRTT